MARKKSPHLTDVELRLMEVLWKRGKATVAEVLEGVESETPPAYSTVLTTLRILENKGYLCHIKDGRAFQYLPVIGREEVKESAIAHLLRKFFENSPEQLVLSLVEKEKISAKELDRLRRRIREAKS